MIKSYSEMISLPTFAERLEYLRCPDEDKMHDNNLKKAFYQSPEWKKTRRYIILRDRGCDLACEGMEIGYRAIIHHINPLSDEDILSRSEKLFDPDNLVCVAIPTHNYIHYGHYQEFSNPIERKPDDTKLW